MNSKAELQVVKNFEGPVILPYLNTRKLTSDCFMDA